MADEVVHSATAFGCCVARDGRVADRGRLVELAIDVEASTILGGVATQRAAEHRARATRVPDRASAVGHGIAADGTAHDGEVGRPVHDRAAVDCLVTFQRALAHEQFAVEPVEYAASAGSRLVEADDTIERVNDAADIVNATAFISAVF